MEVLEILRNILQVMVGVELMDVSNVYLVLIDREAHLVIQTQTEIVRKH
ncbi:hypothetical protein [Chryseobacterium vrystaatense]|nr:hypothetical protein [Chryseobacterium vrystaatense]